MSSSGPDIVLSFVAERKLFPTTRRSHKGLPKRNWRLWPRMEGWRQWRLGGGTNLAQRKSKRTHL